MSLKNFMCHANFELEFGTRLNFIIGHNGSGKSAILTAISVCLGAKATETNRGSSLKDLIREGQNSSRIRVVLYNEGSRAFEHDKYGDEIIIERVIKKDASTVPYVLKSENGTKISTKKADLDAILDFFGIAVNNPMAFLSQDAARSFLTASTDEQKYKFFMRGTLMEEIVNNFKTTENQIKALEGRLLKMKQEVDALRADSKEAIKLHMALLSSNDLRQRLVALQGKYFLLKAQATQEEIEEGTQALGIVQGHIDGIDAHIKQIEETLNNSTKSKSDLEQKVESLHEEAKLAKKRLDNKRNEISTVRAVISSKQDDLTQVNRDIAKNMNQIQTLEKNIKHEEDRIARQSGGSKDELKQQLDSLNETLSSLRQQLDKIDTKLEQEEATYEESEREDRAAIQSVEENIRSIKLQIDSAKDVADAELRPYPPNIRSAVREIKRSNFQSEVVGPLGLYFALKPQFAKFKRVVDTHLGRHFQSFIVSNINDQRLIQNILKRNKCNCQVIVRKNERFDYSSGVPSSNFTTLLDVLQFKNDTIKYGLIDLVNAEKTILVENRESAQRVLENKERNVNIALSLLNETSGQRSSINVHGAFKIDPLYYDLKSYSKLRIAGRESDTSELQDNLRSEMRELEMLKQQFNQKQTSYLSNRQQLTNEKRILKGQYSDTQRELYAVKTSIEDEVDTGKLEVFKEDIENLHRGIEGYKSSIPAIEQDIAKNQEYIRLLEQEAAELKESATAAVNLHTDVSSKASNFEVEKQVQLGKLQHFENSKRNQVSQYQEIESSVEELKKQYEQYMENADKACSREAADAIPLNNIESIKREIVAVEAKVAEANKDLGKSHDEIVRDDKIARAKFNEADSQFSAAVETKQLLHSSLHSRLKNFRETRRTTCSEASMDFNNSLQFRNFTGSLEFDNQKNKLTMFVSTKNDKEPRHVDSLSGGEKSFSQISLLLATWKPMRSSIRGLDEFDVFMDQVNRKIGMRLMLSKLSQEVNTQTIFITPQDIGQIAELDERYVRIHRIKDPRA